MQTLIFKIESATSKYEQNLNLYDIRQKNCICKVIIIKKRKTKYLLESDTGTKW